MSEKMPEGFPPLTLTIMRALCALTLLHPEQSPQPILTKALDTLFHEFWVNQKKTHEKPVLEEVLKGVLGDAETQKVMEMAGNEGKELLGKNTDKALEDGAFGLPV
jgi:2-hydroxychromene-2-carboxylate isomerase